MEKVAKFFKVSFSQYEKNMAQCFPDLDQETIRACYEGIKLPKRATKHSAGYDFYLPVAFTLDPQQTLLMPTGICVEMKDDVVLMLFPRSGLGFKYRLQLNNTVGIIDADYFHADNEGHILAKITNDNYENKTISLHEGDAFMQGIFVHYGITVDDDTDAIRHGGFGSTD